MCCLSSIVSDNVLYGRTCGWHWFIWCRFSGIYILQEQFLRLFVFVLTCNHLKLIHVFCCNPYMSMLSAQAKCLETGEAVAIKKVLQDKRYKNRELQIMHLLDHPNVVQLKHFFFSTTDKDELYLNLVLEYVSETVYRITKYYSRMSQHVPLIYVQLYTYQVDLC